jgi:hypothetical protein
MKKYLALAAAGGALAIGVPAAIAATDTTNTPVQSATPTPGQTAPDDTTPDQQRGGPGGRGDCPEHDGNGGSSDDQGSAAPSTPDPTATPDV